MGNNNEIRDQARRETQEMLSRTPAFLDLNQQEQLALYQQMYEAKATELSLRGPAPRKPRSAMATSMADDDPNAINRNTRIDQAGALIGDFVDQVDFPGFVKELLKGVFDANLEVTLDQMNTYIDLMKEATKAVSEFVRKIPDEEAIYQLADSDPKFSALPNPAYVAPGPAMPDQSAPTPAPGAAPRVILGDKDGNALDMGDNMVKAKILETKIAMAQEQRALLRETILMGVSRLVVEKGVVRATCEFNFKATENIQRSNMDQTKTSRQGGGGLGVGFLGFRFGGGGSTKTTKISISSVAGQQSSELTSKLTGFVEIQFKSDYFRLDNFAEMYGKIKSESPSAAAPAAALPPAR